jgi:hypothetical protein
MRKPATREPCAGEPPARFGGRAGESLPHPIAVRRIERPQAASRGEKPCFCKPLQRIAPIPGSSLRQRGVDGRDKPGHDDKGSKAQSARTELTPYAISAEKSLDFPPPGLDFPSSFLGLSSFESRKHFPRPDEPGGGIGRAAAPRGGSIVQAAGGAPRHRQPGRRRR